MFLPLQCPRREEKRAIPATLGPSEEAAGPGATPADGCGRGCSQGVRLSEPPGPGSQKQSPETLPSPLRTSAVVLVSHMG